MDPIVFNSRELPDATDITRLDSNLLMRLLGGL